MRGDGHGAGDRFVPHNIVDMINLTERFDDIAPQRRSSDSGMELARVQLLASSPVHGAISSASAKIIVIMPRSSPIGPEIYSLKSKEGCRLPRMRQRQVREREKHDHTIDVIVSRVYTCFGRPVAKRVDKQNGNAK